MEEGRLRAPTIVPPNAQLAPAHTATAAIAAMGNRIEIALTTNPTHRSFSDAFTVPAFTHQILFESLLEVTNYSEFHQHRSGKELHIPHAIGACTAQRSVCNAAWRRTGVHGLAAEQNRGEAGPPAAGSGVGATVHASARGAAGRRRGWHGGGCAAQRYKAWVLRGHELFVSSVVWWCTRLIGCLW